MPKTTLFIPALCFTLFLIVQAGQFTQILPVSTTANSLTQERVALLAKKRMRFVTAEGAGTESLTASQTKIGNWEIFNMVDLGNNNVFFRANANGKLVCAQNAGASPLIANRKMGGPWQTFAVQNVTGGVALKSQINGKYVSYGITQKSQLIANQDRVGQNQTFAIVKIYEIALLSFINQKYVTTKDTSQLIASASTLTDNEKFILIMLGGNKVALQSKVNDKYVGNSDYNNGMIYANRESIGTKTTYTLIPVPDGVGFRSDFNQKTICAESEGADALIANRPGAGPWETYSIVFM